MGVRPRRVRRRLDLADEAAEAEVGVRSIFVRRVIRLGVIIRARVATLAVLILFSGRRV